MTPEGGVNILITGERGVGKTHLAGTIGEVEAYRDALVIDIEIGSKTLVGFENLDVIKTRSWDDIIKVKDFLEQGKHNYKTIVVDSLTTAQEFCLKKIMEDKKNTTGAPEQREYNQSTGKMRSLVRSLLIRAQQDDGCLILVSGIRVDKDENTGRTDILPAMTPSLARDIAGMVDTVSELAWDDRSKTRKLYITHKPRTQVKSRKPLNAPELPEYLENPTMKQVIETLTRYE